ncbi:hypothetical protein C8F01DRAFT_1365443 [Mycena amicta]|nr:hypothetical protein C8F01DRAFT_1365443 [Mycena amicta]
MSYSCDCHKVHKGVATPCSAATYSWHRSYHEQPFQSFHTFISSSGHGLPSQAIPQPSATAPASSTSASTSSNSHSHSKRRRPHVEDDWEDNEEYALEELQAPPSPKRARISVSVSLGKMMSLGKSKFMAMQTADEMQQVHVSILIGRAAIYLVKDQNELDLDGSADPNSLDSLQDDDNDQDDGPINTLLSRNSTPLAQFLKALDGTSLANSRLHPDIVERLNNPIQESIDISGDPDLRLSLDLFNAVEEFELLYYNCDPTRIHFIRQSLHHLLHTAPEVEIKQHLNPFANLSQRAVRRAQVNSLKSLISDLEPDIMINTPKCMEIDKGDSDLLDLISSAIAATALSATPTIALSAKPSPVSTATASSASGSQSLPSNPAAHHPDAPPITATANRPRYSEVVERPKARPRSTKTGLKAPLIAIDLFRPACNFSAIDQTLFHDLLDVLGPITAPTARADFIEKKTAKAAPKAKSN